MALALDHDNFDSNISNGLTLVDFWASWCGPCKMLAPSIEELEKDYEGRASICKVDVDECPSLAERFGIYSIPTVLIFKDGELVERVIGYHLKREYSALLDKYI